MTSEDLPKIVTGKQQHSEYKSFQYIWASGSFGVAADY
jgi:hypothetical protein